MNAETILIQHGTESLVADVDEDVFAFIGEISWRVIGGRVMTLHDNQLIDLLSVMGIPLGLPSISKTSGNISFQRSCISSPVITDCFEEPNFYWAKTRGIPEKQEISKNVENLKTYSHQLRNEVPSKIPRSSFYFTPFEINHEGANIALDTLSNSGTVLNLSHWPSHTTPIEFQSNLSAQSVLQYIQSEKYGQEGTKNLSFDHVDTDGLVCLLAFIDPDFASKHSAALHAIALHGDFGRCEDQNYRLMSFAWHWLLGTYRANLSSASKFSNTTDSVTELTFLSLPFLKDIVSNPSKYQLAWKHEEERFLATENLFKNKSIKISHFPLGDLSVFELLGSNTFPEPTLKTMPHYLGLSQTSFHNRSHHRNILLIVDQRKIYIHQRYDSWIDDSHSLNSNNLPGRKDLSIFAKWLSNQQLINPEWDYNGVTQIMPRLAAVLSSKKKISSTQLVDLVSFFLRNSPVVWNGQNTKILTSCSQTKKNIIKQAAM